MSRLEERPTKIRKLDLDLVDNQVSLENDGSSNASAIAPSPNETFNVPSLSPISNAATSVGIIGHTKLAQHLSKNQLKKLRRKTEWEEGREYRKARRREKIKAKKIRKAESRNIADLQSSEDVPPQRRNIQRPVQLPITLILDCDFDELMTEAEMISLGSQLTRCYSDNKTALYRVHLVVSSFNGKLKRRFETVLANNHLGWKGVKFTADDFSTAARDADSVMRGPQGGRLLGAFAGGKDTVPFLQHSLSQGAGETPPSAVAFDGTHPTSVTTIGVEDSGAEQVPVDDKAAVYALPPASTDTLVTENSSDKLDGVLPKSIGAESNGQASEISCEPHIVYLTSDSPHTLDTLSPYTTYVIGGLVDKNRHKGICYKRSMARNIPTAKLPIGEYMTMQSRSVLATNHVAEIMIRWLEYGDWAKAFLQVIPKRKEARLKAGQGTENSPRNDEKRKDSSSSQEE